MVPLRMLSCLSKFRNCTEVRTLTSKLVSSDVNQFCKRYIHEISEDEEKQRNQTLHEMRNNLHGGSIDLNLNNENGIAVMKLNFPEKKNALSGSMIAELEDTVNKLKSWEQGKGLIIMGADDFFCAGMDINTVSSYLTPSDGYTIGKYMHDQLNTILDLPLISVSYIQGNALGGGSEITTATDFRIMAPDAEIGFIHPRLNALTGWGGGSRLTALLGRSIALQLLSSGKIINAEKALSIGLVNEIVDPQGDAEKTATEWLQKYTFSSLDSVRGNKTTVVAACQGKINDALKVELEMIKKVWGSESHLKALKKFFPKKF